MSVVGKKAYVLLRLLSGLLNSVIEFLKPRSVDAIKYEINKILGNIVYTR